MSKGTSGQFSLLATFFPCCQTCDHKDCSPLHLCQVTQLQEAVGRQSNQPYDRQGSNEHYCEDFLCHTIISWTIHYGYDAHGRKKPRNVFRTFPSHHHPTSTKRLFLVLRTVVQRSSRRDTFIDLSAYPEHGVERTSGILKHI